MGIADRLRALEKSLDPQAADSSASSPAGWADLLADWRPAMVYVERGESVTDEERQAVVEQCRELAERIYRGELASTQAILDAMPRAAFVWLAAEGMRMDMAELKSRDKGASP